ncbi:MAG: DNA repair protein RecO [Gammaproteobacteria bacterium]|nr:DNA repair protein RecO [Gammaproteobacteria bacterium]MBT8133779.1 DNA repair protein RecO [Gammaproteobacteria bacterium]NNJ50149.1 DNA repair protein RecO [Gammaproteobacteria bacterium]
MNVVNTQIAYILHKRAYRETSSILEVLTRDYGRLALMARGTRGAKSKIAGNLLPFTPLLISWQGKGDLPYLKSVERADLKAPSLQSKSLLSAMYINELMMYLLHRDDVHETVFEHYHHCLYALENDKELEITLRQFEIKLLELLGFGLNLLEEADSGKPIIAEAYYYYHLEHGPVLCTDAATRSENVSMPRLSGRCLQALAAENYRELSANTEHLREIKRLMRFVINFHLGNKKLKSRELFRPVNKDFSGTGFS